MLIIMCTAAAKGDGERGARAEAILIRLADTECCYCRQYREIVAYVLRMLCSRTLVRKSQTYN